MRQVFARLALAIGLLAIALAGCNQLPLIRRDGAAAPPAGKTPDAPALIEYLNDNARRVQALRCDNVDVACRMGVRSIGLDAVMLCQKPRNFRLRGRVLGNPAVDVGSNGEEFWYWMSKNDPPRVFHCAYRDLTAKVNLPFPFHPDMVVSALGIQEYNPAAKFEVKENGKYLELIETTNTLQGQPGRKVTVFVRHAVKAPQPQIVAHLLQDSRGKTICKATIEQTQVDRGTGAILPRVLTLEWPAQDLRMKLTFHGLTTTTFTAVQQGRYFSRNDLEKYGSIDLARGAPDGPPRGRAGVGGPLRRR